MHQASFTPYTCRAPIRAAVALAAIVFSVGCATPPPPAAPPVSDPIADRLQEAIVKISALPEFTRSADNQAPAAQLGALVTASFQGDAAQLLRRVADARGMELKIRGPKPYLPLVVHVDAVNQPIDDFLKDVGYQFGQRADLVVADGAIEIRYRGQP